MAIRRDQSLLPQTETRGQIIDSAKRVFREHGYHDVSMETVRLEANVSKATIYFYFASKHDLFRATAQTITDTLFEQSRERFPGIDPFEKIVAANAAYLGIWIEESRILGDLLALSLVDATISGIWEDHRNAFGTRIEQSIIRNQEVIQPDEARLMASCLGSMVQLFCFRFTNTAEAASTAYFSPHEALKVVSETWYSAIFREPPPINYPYEVRHPLPVPQEILRTSKVIEGAPIDSLTQPWVSSPTRSKD